MDVAEKLKIKGLSLIRNNSSMLEKSNKLEKEEPKANAETISEVKEVDGGIMKSEEISTENIETSNEMDDIEELCDITRDIMSEVQETTLALTDSLDDTNDDEELHETTAEEIAEKHKTKLATTLLIGHKRKTKCDECDYTASHAGNLKVHILAKHQILSQNIGESAITSESQS